MTLLLLRCCLQTHPGRDGSAASEDAAMHIVSWLILASQRPARSRWTTVVSPSMEDDSEAWWTSMNTYDEVDLPSPPPPRRQEKSKRLPGEDSQGVSQWAVGDISQWSAGGGDAVWCAADGDEYWKHEETAPPPQQSRAQQRPAGRVEETTASRPRPRPRPRPRSLYDDLGCPREASSELLRRCYKEACKRHHPDVSGGTSEQFSAITRAWDVLGDPARRRTYDAELRRRERAGE